MFKALHAILITLAAMTPLASQATDVGISIGISQPGIYGRIDIGRYPQPVLIQQQPVYVQPVRYARPEPAYLWVPYGHRKKWHRHCYRYNACGTPVYFVRDDWYERRVMLPYRYEHSDRRDRDDDDHHHRGRGRHGRDD